MRRCDSRKSEDHLTKINDVTFIPEILRLDLLFRIKAKLLNLQKILSGGKLSQKRHGEHRPKDITCLESRQAQNQTLKNRILRSP